MPAASTSTVPAHRNNSAFARGGANVEEIGAALHDCKPPARFGEVARHLRGYGRRSLQSAALVANGSDDRGIVDLKTYGNIVLRLGVLDSVRERLAERERQIFEIARRDVMVGSEGVERPSRRANVSR